MRAHYLQVLQLSENASKEEIKAAYRALSKQYHPDLNPSPNAHEKFLEIKAAYDYLTNEQPEETLFEYFDPYAAERQRQEQEEAEYKAWRAEARRQAKQRELEKQRYQEQLIRQLVRYFTPIGVIILLFNVSLTVDYLLPYTYHQQEVLKVAKGYETTRSSTYYRYDIIYFEDYTMKFDIGQLSTVTMSKAKRYSDAEVAVTPLFDKPMVAYITVEGERRRFDQLYNVYIIFGYLIPFMLITSVLFFYLKNQTYKLNAAIILFTLSIFQLIFFF